jgi:hypothetical protein
MHNKRCGCYENVVGALDSTGTTHFMVVNNNMISLNLFVVKDTLTTKQRIDGMMDYELITSRFLEKVIPKRDGSPNEMAFEGG